MTRASDLHRLQQIDTNTHKIGLRLEEIQVVLSDSTAVSAHQEALAQAAEKLQQVAAANRKAEHEVGSRREKMAQTEQKLYGGAIKNPKELHDLQQEAESLKRHLSTLEDRLLEAMVALDEAEQEHQAAQQALQQAEAQEADQNANLLEERAILLRDVERLQTERAAALATVNEQDLALYDRLQQSMGPQVVALVEGDSCSICGLTLPASARQAARSPGDLVRCAQCGRILYRQ
ncbi:MAG: hypothetical protein PVF70_02955 [Anaerolineales bacterium]|jgi:hypothetical protein